jgi:hypothetical protein
MSYPNSALAVWQLTLIALVVVSSLAVWLVLVYAAARPPRPNREAARPVRPAEPARPADALAPPSHAKAA